MQLNKETKSKQYVYLDPSLHKILNDSSNFGQ